MRHRSWVSVLLTATARSSGGADHGSAGGEVTALLTKEAGGERAEEARSRPPRRRRHVLSNLDTKVSPHLFVATLNEPWCSASPYARVARGNALVAVS